jgi:hypothetical protein
MKNQSDTSLQIRMAGLAILGLFIALAAAFVSGRQVKHCSELITTDAVPGTIMRTLCGWPCPAASAGKS